MQRLQAFKFELMPNGQQMRKMSQFAGMCRFVFNQALALQKENHEAGNKFLNYAALTKHLTVWRNSPETAWLSQGPSRLYAVLCGNASRHVGMAGANGLAGRCLSLDMRR